VAADLGGDRIVVIDSAGAGGMLGVQVLAAAKSAAAGASLPDVVERVRLARQDVRMWGLVDTLEYFRRGGRISSVAMWMGSALDIKPILTVEYDIKAVERVRTRKRGIERLVELMRQHHSRGADRWFLNHAHAIEEAQPLIERLHEIFSVPPEFLWELSPLLGTHAGPGSLWVGSVTSAALR
jgi:DegV family protein with EDD domain